MFSINCMGSLERFDLSPDGHGETDLLLTADHVPAAEWHEVHAGWLNILYPLKAWLTHGVALRNRDSTRTWDYGYADQ